MSADLPKRIGRYEIDRLLGAGAMGNVYLARDPELDRRVALKTVRYGSLPPDQIDTFLERFRNEARAAAKLHHPNVVQIFDVGDAPDVGPYLVFEYVAGQTLKQHLRTRGKLDAEALVVLADEVAEALGVAHAQGIVHRDIKPDNLLLTESGRAKLADFGVARLPNAELTREGQFLGTPCYAAPETLKHGTYGPSTDAFSFASVLYEAATGTRAFPGDDAVAVAHKVMHDDVPPPSSVSSVPRELDDVFARALAKDPAARFHDATELAHALRDAFEQSGVLAGSTARDATVRIPRREIVAEEPESPLARAAIVIGLLALGLVALFAYQDDARAPLAADASVAPQLRDDPPRPLRPQRVRRVRRDASVVGPSPAPASAPQAPALAPGPAVAPATAPPPSPEPAPAP